MRMEVQGRNLRIAGVKELGTANATAFRNWVRHALAEDHQDIEIDLSETTLLDSCGLGALIALHTAVGSRGGKLRLRQPQPPIQQILELTRMDQIFEVVQA
jgi:anti-sigma B factor antagonist